MSAWERPPELLSRGGGAASRASLRAADVRSYLAYGGVSPLLRDAVAALLASRPANPQQVLLDWLEEAAAGRGAAGRSFAAVVASPRNVVAFGQSVHEAYADVDGAMRVSMADLHQMLLLVCPDLPLEVVERPARALQEASLFDAVYDFGSLSAAVLVFLYFRPALAALEALYERDQAAKGLGIEEVLAAARRGLGRAATHLNLGNKRDKAACERIVAPVVEGWRPALEQAFGDGTCRSYEEVQACILRCRALADELRRRDPVPAAGIDEVAVLDLFRVVEPLGMAGDFEEDDTDMSEGGRLPVIGWEGRLSRRARRDTQRKGARKQASSIARKSGKRSAKEKKGGLR